MTDQEIEEERRLVYGRAARRLAAAAVDTTTWAAASPAPTLADMLAACDTLEPPEPAGYAVHPADVEKLRRLFASPHDGASSLVNGGRMLYGLEIIPDAAVEVGRPEPLTAAQIRERLAR